MTHATYFSDQSSGIKIADIWHPTKRSKNSKKIWNGFKEMINIKQRSSSLPTSLIDRGNIITNGKDIANHFNFYFSGIAGNILKKRIYKG